MINIVLFVIAILLTIGFDLGTRKRITETPSILFFIKRIICLLPMLFACGLAFFYPKIFMAIGLGTAIVYSFYLTHLSFLESVILNLEILFNFGKVYSAFLYVMFFKNNFEMQE